VESLTFFKDLDVFDDPSTITESHHFRHAPKDWVVFVTDIVDSTRAIKEGRYKDVNTVGASCIIAVLNALGDVEIPYAFGGDGANLLVPLSLAELTKKTLIAVKAMALEQFGLVLRVGAIPLSEIVSLGSDIQVAKYAMSKNFNLAMFRGGGLALAEKLIKHPHSKFICNEELSGKADFTGLECRWEPVKAERGVIVTAIVEAQGKTQEELGPIYLEVIQKINAATDNSLNLFLSGGKNLKLNVKPITENVEYRARTFQKNVTKKLFYFLKILIETFAGKILIGNGSKFLGVDWEQYKKDVITHSDFWKYSDTLRFVADISKNNLIKLTAILDEFKAAGRINYGLHIADSALMTCLVFNRKGNHVHFIDGNNGGYALAAQELKARSPR
jgi:hypothetical protein